MQPLPSGSSTKAGEDAKGEKADLALKVVAHEGRAMVMTQLHAEDDALAEAAE